MEQNLHYIKNIQHISKSKIYANDNTSFTLPCTINDNEFQFCSEKTNFAQKMLSGFYVYAWAWLVVKICIKWTFKPKRIYVFDTQAGFH